MTKQEQRWYLEYVLLPESMFSEQASEIVQGIMVTHQQFFINVYNNMNADVQGYVCPYTVKDFDIDAMLLGDYAGLIRITMPPAENPGELVRVYIGHDNRFQRIRLYSVKIDEDGDRCFMTWVDDSHYKNHGKIFVTEAEENQAAFDFYVKYWLSTEKGTEGEQNPEI